MDRMVAQNGVFIESLALSARDGSKSRNSPIRALN